MRLAISNIAWERADDLSVAGLLRRHSIDAIDIAPGKYFPEPALASEADIRDVKRWWSDQGIEITGMQALLFGTHGLNVFGTPDVRHALLRHLEAVCRIGGLLSAPRIVFGSPKNRDRSGLDENQALDAAGSFFQALGDIAAGHGVQICLEPNPVRYGANFMRNSDETATVVHAVAHPAIRMQLDTGALTLNDENIEQVLEAHSHIIGHIHASEPDLVPLGDGATPHASMARYIGRYLAQHLVTIEMVATKTEPALASIERALGIATASYRIESGSAP